VESLIVVIPGVQNDNHEAGMGVSNVGILDLSSADITLAQQTDRYIGVICIMMSSNDEKHPPNEVAVYGAT